MKRHALAWPLTRNYIYQALRGVGFRSRGQAPAEGIAIKSVDHKTARMKLSIRLPKMHMIRTDDEIKGSIYAAFGLYHRVIDLRVRRNKKWIGITLVLDCSRWALGNQK